MAEAADTTLRPHDPIEIYGNEQFTRENGVVRGQGTPASPFIIEGWDISPLPGYGGGVSLSGTDAWVVVRNVRVQPGSFNLAGVSNVHVENVSSSGAYTGIMVHSSRQVVISKAIVFQNYNRGIHLYNSANITISESKITKNDWASFDEDAALLVDRSSNVTLSRNEIASNLGHGLKIEYSRNTSLFQNTISFNGISGLDLYQTESVSAVANTIVGDGIVVFGTQPSHVSHAIGQDNTVDGKPVYYYNDCNDVRLDGPSTNQLIIANCQDVQVSNLKIGPSAIAVQIFFSNKVQVSNGNFSKSGVGIVIGYSSNVTVAGTTIEGNIWGVNTYFSSNLLFHHNSFIGNNLHAREFYNFFNVSWDAGYPVGGNYWSGYGGSDNCNGPDQDQCSGPDGFGDTPYLGDRYPLLRPVSPSDTHNVRITGVSSSAVSILQGHTLQLTVSARNEGTVEETFQVTLYSNQTQVGSQTVTLLSPGADWTFSFSWSTEWVPPGIYTISAATTLVFGDISPGDNRETGSPVTVDRDTIPPTWPAGATLRSPAVSAISVDLEWSSATDNGVVVEYRLYQNSALVGAFKGNTASVGGLRPDTAYSFKLEAVDGGNNLSNDGPFLTVRTSPDTSPPVWSNSTLLYASISFDTTTFFWTVTLSWSSSVQDNVQVTNFRVYQDGRELALLPGNTRYYTVTGLVPTTKHVFKVEAADAGGNWSTDGPSANVTLPPCQGACIYYALTYEGTPSSGSSVTLVNEFTDGGITRVRVIRVEVTTDFGAFTWTPPSTSTPCISLDCEIPEAINLSTGEKKAVRITTNIPSGTLPGNYTIVGKVTWQYFEQQYDYLYGRTFWVWSTAPPLTLQGSIIVTRVIPTNEPDTTGPIPDIRELPTIPLELLRNLLSPAMLPFLIGGYILFGLVAIGIIVHETRRKRVPP